MKTKKCLQAAWREVFQPEDYDPVQRGWYQQAAEEKSIIVTDPYCDALTGQMCTTIAAPIYIESELAGVIGLDVTLETVTELTDSINYESGVYGFLVDSNGQYVVHQNKEFEPTEETTVGAADILPKLGELIVGAQSGVKMHLLKNQYQRNIRMKQSRLARQPWR